MTFAHFAVCYDLDTSRGGATEPTSGRQPRAQLQNGLGWVRLRRKAPLRIPVQTVEITTVCSSCTFHVGENL